MIRALLNTVPTWGIMILVVGGAIAIALGAFYLMRRFAPSIAHPENNEIASVLIGVLGGVYGIILGSAVCRPVEQHLRDDGTPGHVAAGFAHGRCPAG